MPKRLRLIFILAGFCGGIAVGSWLVFSWGAILISGSLVCLGIYLLSKNFYSRAIVLACLTFLVGAWWAGRDLAMLRINQPYHYSGLVMVQSLRFAATPQQRAVVTLLDGPKAGLNVRISTYDWTYSPGTHLKITATILPSRYTSDRGSNIIGSSIDAKVLQVDAPPSGLNRWRGLVERRLQSCLPEPYASLAIGLLLGANDAFDSQFKADLQRTGTTHLVAVSGYNIMIVALALQQIGRRRGEVAGFMAACMGIVIYVALAGAGASILRGAIMAVLALVASLAGRVTHRLVLLLLGATLLSLIMPMGMLYNVSWQLSFLAFSGLVFLSPLLKSSLLPYLGSRAGLVAETLGAELMVLPYLTVVFGLVSFISPLVNLAVLWLVPAAMAVSVLQAFVAVLWLPAGRLVSWLTYPMLAAIIKPIQWASRIPFPMHPLGFDRVQPRALRRQRTHQQPHSVPGLLHAAVVGLDRPPLFGW